MIYEPAEDSYLIERHIKEYAKGKVLDVGTGSGLLAVEARKYTNNITASDINPECEKELKKHNIRFIHSDLFNNIKENYDLVLFNPPYLPEDKNEPEISKRITTGGKSGNEVIEKFLKQAKSHLNKNGKILIIASTLTPKIPELFTKHGYKCELIEEEHCFFEKIQLWLLSLQAINQNPDSTINTISSQNPSTQYSFQVRA